MSSSPIYRAVILGCGSSGGVPRPDGDWGSCDPENPRNRRRRCSLLVEYAENKALFDAGQVTRIIVDTSPDFREQMLSANVKRIDAVLMTHEHADQAHGIDDLRPYVLRAKRRMPVWMIPETRQTLKTRFSYVFDANEGSPYPAILESQDTPTEGETFTISGPGGQLPIQMGRLEHGKITVAGYRIGPIAYSPDVSGVPDRAFSILSKADVWIVDALRETPHPTHASVSDALAWLQRAQTKRGVLTNLHVDLDYDALRQKLPTNVSPAFDGLEIVVSNNAIEMR